MLVRFDANALDGRDARLIAGALPYFQAFARHYARLRVTGLEHVPRAPCLFVANHNGGIFGPDLLCTLGTLWSTLGPEAPLYALAHDFAMRQLTPLGCVLRAFGALRAAPENAYRVLRAGGQVLVYPGGDIEAYRPYAHRDQIVLGRRRGFLGLGSSASRWRSLCRGGSRWARGFPTCLCPAPCSFRFYLRSPSLPTSLSRAPTGVFEP